MSLRTAPLWIILSWVVGMDVWAERVAWSWDSGVVEGLGMGMLNLGLACSWDGLDSIMKRVSLGHDRWKEKEMG